MDDASLSLIEEFQNHIGKRIQRFHPRVPNVCSFYGLGWMRLERIIQIKKLMFIRSILAMDDDDLPKKIFCERANVYFSDNRFGNENQLQSAIFDLLNVSQIFGLLNDVRNMVERQHFYPKSVWKSKVWEKGWQLEDLHWRIEKQLYRSLDIFNGVSPVNMYLTWWSIADMYPQYIKECEIMAKIVCHASLLKGDDFKLKSLVGTTRMCDLCNCFEIEDARHFVLRCPFFACERCYAQTY